MLSLVHRLLKSGLLEFLGIDALNCLTKWSSQYLEIVLDIVEC